MTLKKEVEKVKLYVDMDGTLCEWRTDLKSDEELFKKGYFLSLKENPETVKAVKEAIARGTDVCVLSHYLSDSIFALSEKKEWLQAHLPELKAEKQYFVPYGEKKAAYVLRTEGRAFLSGEDMLLDDYSVNLHDWEANGGRGVKLLNGINGNFGTWKGPKVEEGSCATEELMCLI